MGASCIMRNVFGFFSSSSLWFSCAECTLSVCVFEEHLRFVNPSCITWCSSGPETVSLCAATNSSLDFPAIY